jgi:DNA-directed RNA polymerase subunit omega
MSATESKNEDVAVEKPLDQAWYIPQDEEKGVYRFIIAAAKRARQLHAGARATISTTHRKSSKIAMEEVRAGMIAVEIPPDDASADYASQLEPNLHG